MMLTELALDFAEPALQNGNWTLREQLEALASFLPTFTAPGFSFGHTVESRKTGDVWSIPYYATAPEADDFVQVANDYGWVRSFDWGEWAHSNEGKLFRTNLGALDHASPNQIAKVLTAVIRSDRFSEGALGNAFASGMLTRIVRRAKALLDDIGPTTA
ncbi:hypothetical protein JKG68_07710 [Microvirga aerilata]|uniref:Uncharacterized protein n=1 Tax=Microvirga aerilata TaxID=670292 RepID=A0A937D184_9HYPH|nr:DUF6508 domain-containing protein [Microvirga aerilata]MBL0403845.1 hypothetical protein [Microvirga aerilata]